MNILVVSQYFWPEDFLINDFVQGLLERKHKVEVLTGLPNYPSGKFFKGYGHFGPYKDCYNGVIVWRTPVFRRGKAKGLQLLLNYVSFVISACLRGLLFHRRSFDIILVFEVSPVSVGIPARFIKWLTKARLFFWVQDLWPDTLVATGAVHSKFILNWVGKLTRWIYSGCDRVLIQSEAFRASVEQFGVRGEQIRYFPNYADEIFRPMDVADDAAERKLMPSGFCVMFAGNIGKAQSFETILSAAALTVVNTEIHWVIVGDGRERAWVEKEVKRRGLSNVHLLGRYEKEKMPIFFSLTDVLLVSLRREAIFSVTIPSKMQPYLACGRPIIASLDGEGARIVEESRAGIAVPAESAEALAEAVFYLYGLDRQALHALGQNARQYFESFFSRKHILDEFCRLLDEVYREKRGEE